MQMVEAKYALLMLPFPACLVRHSQGRHIHHD
jgi:hypothetical protein